jgi:hypothetical protein
MIDSAIICFHRVLHITLPMGSVRGFIQTLCRPYPFLVLPYLYLYQVISKSFIISMCTHCDVLDAVCVFVCRLANQNRNLFDSLLVLPCINLTLILYWVTYSLVYRLAANDADRSIFFCIPTQKSIQRWADILSQPSYLLPPPLHRTDSISYIVRIEKRWKVKT